MTGIRVFLRVRRVLLVGLAFAALPVRSALADTTIGQTGPPASGENWAAVVEAINPSAAVVAAGDTITRFQTQSSTCQGFSGFAQGTYDFQVLRPEGNNEYLIVGDAGNQTDPCDGQLHSYPVGIPVQPGDVIGAYIVNPWVGVLDPGSGVLFANPPPQPEPAVGDTVTVADSFPGVQLDESATLVPLPTDKDQCKGGGWKNFGTTFNNQGECVSFVANGGTTSS